MKNFTTTCVPCACSTSLRQRQLLYVTLEHFKRLEGEVVNQLEAWAHTQDQLGFEGETVTLQQLRGIELNERAAALAELVLWIGYLQWHIRTRGHAAVADARRPQLRQHRMPRRRAGLGRTRTRLRRRGPAARAAGMATPTKPTPSPAKKCPTKPPRCRNGATWARAPPPGPKPISLWATRRLLAQTAMRDALGDGYTQAPARRLARGARKRRFRRCSGGTTPPRRWPQGHVQRMGLITTNSLRHGSRRVVQAALDQGTHLVMAIPDHPGWDSTGMARLCALP